MAEKCVELFRRANESGTLVIDATLNSGGSIKVFFHDIGVAPEETFGDRDYEHWITVPAEEVGALALALLQHCWAGSVNAMTEVKRLCQANGIEIQEHSF